MCDFNTTTFATVAPKGKKLSIDTVNTVVEFLILTFGQTTTLDVKSNLRKLGFEATQQEVSDLMDKIYEARKAGEYAPYELDGKTVDLTYQSNGSFRIYSFGTPVAAATTKATTTASAPAKVKAPVKATVSNRDYIQKNIYTDSAVLAKKLGISVASVRAYKANINR